MRTLTLIIVFTLSLFINVYSQMPPDSCLKILADNEYPLEFQNPDSIKVDSCINSPTFRKFFAKEFFAIVFLYNVLPSEGLFPEDTIIEYIWEDIDSQYINTKLGFMELEEEYGKFWFREVYPEEEDTNETKKRILSIRFENYVNIDSVKAILNNILFVDYVSYVWRSGIIYSSVETFGIHLSEIDFKIFPQPANDELFIKENKEYPLRNVEIFSILGLKVMDVEYSDKINISHLSAGIYFLKCGDRVLKFVKGE